MALVNVTADEFAKAMKKTGRVTLTVEETKDKIFVKGKGVRFTLDWPDGWTKAQVLGSPTFHDKEGNTWNGRYYPQSKTIHFQRVARRDAVAKSRIATKKKARAAAK